MFGEVKEDKVQNFFLVGMQPLGNPRHHNVDVTGQNGELWENASACFEDITSR